MQRGTNILGLIFLNLGLQYICLGSSESVITNNGTSAIVSEWPADMMVLEGVSKQIPFTFHPNATFVMANLKALFHGGSSPKTIYQATQTSSGIQPGFENDFEAIPESPHDLRIKEMDSKLAGDYMATVINPDLEEETRQFKVAALSRADCTFGSVTDYVLDGEKVSLYCTVTYNGSPEITLKWYDYMGRELEGEYVDARTPSSAKQRTYRHSFTAGVEHDGRQFLCQVSSPEDTEYTDKCSTSFLVLSSSAECSVHLKEGHNGMLNVLECSAVYTVSKPPVMKWYDDNLKLMDVDLSEKDIPPVGERPALKERSLIAMDWDFTAKEYTCVAHFPEGPTNMCNVTSNVREVCECYDHVFHVKCTSPSVIKILGGKGYNYGSSYCSSCPTSRTHCSESMALYYPSKLEESKTKCNGQSSCSVNSGSKKTMPKCGTSAYAYYTELYYICEDPE